MEIFKILENGIEKVIELKKVEELEPIFGNRKSFYGKAFVYEDAEGNLYLRSYDTIVSVYKNGKVTHFGKFSQTTSRHQKEFERMFQ